VIKVFRGKGALPPSLSWNGRADDGTLASADGVSYDLRVTDAKGKVLERHALLGPAPAAAGGLEGEMAGVEGADYGLRSDNAAAPRPKVHPSLKGRQDLVISGADFDLSSVQDPGAHQWELRVVDSEGKTLKSFSGTGRPPKSLRWSGTDDMGQPISASLGTGYVLRVTSGDGSVKRVADELVAPEAFAGLAAKARSEPMDSPCGRDPKTGELYCMLHFKQGSSDLDDEAEETLKRILSVLRMVKFQQLNIEGHADNEGDQDMNYQLSQQRADTVMKEMLEDGAMTLTRLVAIGKADTEPVADNSTEEGRARNRRVEIRFKEGP